MGVLHHKAGHAPYSERPFTLISVLIIVVLLVLLISTGWFMNSSQDATETSVHNISEFYLKQLSGQTGRQMQGNLNYQIQILETAIRAIGKEDLADETSLQQYISFTIDNCDIDFYGIVSESGTVYTDHQIISKGKNSNPLSSVDFDHTHFFVDNSSGTENMVVIVMPIHNLKFKGQNLIGGIAGINASTISSQLMLKNEEDQIFSNVILKDGSYIVKTPHYHIRDNDNIFSALEEQVTFQEGYSLEEMQENIQAGKSGIVAYYLQNSLHYTYYAPAEVTDWYLTTTIHYDTVSTNVELVRSIITRNSMILLLVMLLVVFAVFMVFFWQWRKFETKN